MQKSAGADGVTMQLGVRDVRDCATECVFSPRYFLISACEKLMVVLESVRDLSKFTPRIGKNEKHTGRWWDADAQAEYNARDAVMPT